MKKRYTSKLIREMNEMLDKGDRLNEMMNFGEDTPFSPESNEPGFDAGPDLTGYGDETVDEPAEKDDPEVTGIINNIRQMALNGIAKLANNPTSRQYDALKKIWQIVDKTVEIKDDKRV